ncbi:MAG: hypothetical protein P8X57_09885 [Cyclobacteriaceae bacterium]
MVREDPVKPDLLFAGTETGLYISVNGGKSWEGLQLNLPVTPITDLKIHENDLVVATSGRSFWILDDLGLIRQYEGEKKFGIYRPDDTYLGHWYSEMNSNGADGMDLFEGVNPPNGLVIYYMLPEEITSENIRLEIYNSQNNLIRTISSVKDSTYQRYDGGPPPPAVLDNEQGINRFVWDMRHETMPGVEGVYIEGSYRGHKVIPGTYRLVLTNGDESDEVNAVIRNNPRYEVSPETFREYDNFMKKAEEDLAEMHSLVNRLDGAREQIDRITRNLPQDEEFDELRFKGKLLSQELKEWDNDMVQRKSKAYDDVENFPNKFTAEFLFMLNQTESAIPRVNNPSRERYTELMQQWIPLKDKAEKFLNDEIPEFNKALWDKGIGAINSQ